jgi:hypothetical protein
MHYVNFVERLVGHFVAECVSLISLNGLFMFCLFEHQS